MPDPFERHGRNSWEWGPSPPRGQSRQAAADQDLAAAKRPPAKKDPKLCKAVHWKGPHVPELRYSEVRWHMGSRCRWDVSWSGKEPAYFCHHEEVCTGCGKGLRFSIPDEECPAFAPLTDERRAEIEQQLEESRLRRARRVRNRLVIDGPQGYRKPKEKSA